MKLKQLIVQVFDPPRSVLQNSYTYQTGTPSSYKKRVKSSLWLTTFPLEMNDGVRLLTRGFLNLRYKPYT